MPTKGRLMSKAITKVPAGALAVPEYMGLEPTGTEDLKQFIVPPRLKVIQKQAADELLQQFGVADVILSPANALVHSMPRDSNGRPKEDDAEPFLVVPLFFCPDYVTWNPIELGGNAIRARTLDPTSDIAMKSRDPEKRFEPCPENEDLTVRHVEHLNFVCLLHGSDMFTDPVVLSFARAEHAAGRRWANLISMRKAPIFGCVFAVHVRHRENTMGDWWGLEVVNPAAELSPPWVGKEDFPVLKVLHEELAKAHSEALLRVGYEPPERDEDVADEL